jgi:hypothetical protein
MSAHERSVEPLETAKKRSIRQPDSPVVRSGELIPTPRVRLKTLDAVRTEMAKVYRAMKTGQIDTADGTKLAYVLSQLGKLIVESDLERRLQTLEGVTRGKP